MQMKCKNINGKIQKNKQKTNGKFRVNNIKKQELKDKGVTMLSLVVTIVILLILSGITIKFALDDNGIIKQSKLASEKYKNSTIQEQRTLNEISKEMSTTSSNAGTSGEGSSESDDYNQIKQENEELKNEIKNLKENQATGNATEDQVLAGATFSTLAGSGLTGTMTNNGTWTANTTGSGNITIPAGYHNGKGYVSGAGAYSKGVSDADSRVNINSVSYTEGYKSGGNDILDKALEKSNIEYGAVSLGVVSTHDMITKSIKYSKTHATAAKTILLTYSWYDYFNGCLHVSDRNNSASGFDAKFYPSEYGNGYGEVIVYWVALW